MRWRTWWWRSSWLKMAEKGEHRVYLGLGSNLGDRRENLLAALRLLKRHPGIEVEEVSSVYQTEPWGVTEQPDFLNLVALIRTDLGPREILEACMGVERDLGRVRGERWGPRVIDVDILMYDDIEWVEDDLVIPHPRMMERDFVMVPLMELEPEISPPEGTESAERTAGRENDKVKRAFRYRKEEWHG